MLWKLDDWEATIEGIVNEMNQSPQSGKRKVLTNWRERLEEKPTRLQPFQIDMIVREVRSRLKDKGK